LLPVSGPELPTIRCAKRTWNGQPAPDFLSTTQSSSGAGLPLDRPLRWLDSLPRAPNGAVRSWVARSFFRFELRAEAVEFFHETDVDKWNSMATRHDFPNYALSRNLSGSRRADQMEFSHEAYSGCNPRPNKSCLSSVHPEYRKRPCQPTQLLGTPTNNPVQHN